MAKSLKIVKTHNNMKLHKISFTIFVNYMTRYSSKFESFYLYMEDRQIINIQKHNTNGERDTFCRMSLYFSLSNGWRKNKTTSLVPLHYLKTLWVNNTEKINKVSKIFILYLLCCRTRILWSSKSWKRVHTISLSHCCVLFGLLYLKFLVRSATFRDVPGSIGTCTSS